MSLHTAPPLVIAVQDPPEWVDLLQMHNPDAKFHITCPDCGTELVLRPGESCPNGCVTWAPAEKPEEAVH